MFVILYRRSMQYAEYYMYACMIIFCGKTTKFPIKGFDASNDLSHMEIPFPVTINDWNTITI